MQRTARKAQQAARYAAVGVRASFKALSNPVVVRSLAVAGVILLVVTVLVASASSVSALFSTFTYPANDGALTDVYAYVTELDTNLEQEIKDIPKKPEWATMNEFNIATFVPKTDPMLILSYLSVKYGAFKLNDVKGEIATIHAAMYHLVYTPRSEVKHVAEVLNPDGTASPATDQVINHLDVTLNYTPFQAYVSLHKAEMFPKADDYAMFETYSQVGGMSLRSELGVPFVGKTVTVSSRYGWRFDPVTKIKNFHGGIDIPMPAGTPINATMGGTVTTSYDANGFGNVVVITSGNRKTLYGHCSSLLVSNGQIVTQGQEIARVGNTGKSTGDHLHLEFEKDGKSLNPFFFIQKEQFIVGLNGGLAGAALGDGQYAAIVVEGEKYLGFPYVFGGKTPATSFDCSGFVSWVLTHSGVKQISASAQGLYDNCTPINETELKPGDLIFFQGTYNCPDTVTHVAFYVGGDMMLQCGDPIQYASFKTSYWQNHFFAYGRVN
ncbi:MAG TPA: peptidoglycan DD-metalloendopeptidase family protein [Desulfosporosinus sp.]